MLLFTINKQTWKLLTSTGHRTRKHSNSLRFNQLLLFHSIFLQYQFQAQFQDASFKQLQQFQLPQLHPKPETQKHINKQKVKFLHNPTNTHQINRHSTFKVLSNIQ